MISLVTNTSGNEIGYLIDEFFIPSNTVKAVTEGKISYESKREGFFERDKVVIPELKKKFSIFSRDYTEKTGSNYLSILRKNNIVTKRYAYIGVSTDETKKNCEHYIWGMFNTQCGYAIYDTKLEKTVGYLLTSTDLYNSSEPNIHICMIEIMEKGQGIGTQVIRELLRYRPIRGLADNGSKPFWNKFSAKYLSDSMHFTIE